MSNYFIALEGIDGSGKTSVKQQLYRLFSEKGKEPLTVIPQSWRDALSTQVIVSAKYDGINYPKDIITRAYVKDKELLYREMICPHLSYRSVISDRYILSDLVYHQQLYGISPVDTFEAYKNSGLVFPDYLIFIKTDPLEAYQRILNRNPNAIHKWERPEILTDLYQTFLECLDFMNCNVIILKNDSDFTSLKDEVNKLFTEYFDE
ncbi:deoxynucleoside kinase [Hazenella sp. IB182357]|uniref:Thymidylate kinase n=1 Tax=Polycladospora coralii TaxID=2771432 RepID=A0A926RUU2_9BACL|nr:deoxynucleoside kinase [Polycladospora coralii]MBD1373408.1 deoxynucleoside kinase [Polycladospora coralii]